MNLRDLKYVVALADIGHFRKAAESVFVSQSTLSIQIKQLEELLGITLFDRSVTPVCPTIKGLTIIESARRIVAESEQIRQWAEGMRDPMNTTVKLAIIPTLAPYYLPFAISVLQKHYPKLKILLFELQTHDILQRLQQGALDAGVLALPLTENEQRLEKLALFSEPFVLTYPSNLKLPIDGDSSKRANSSKVHSAENWSKWFTKETDLSMLLLEDGHCLRGQALSACQMMDPTSELVRATSLETLRQMVAQGLGYTLMPYLATVFARDSRLSYQALSPKVHRQIGLVYRKKTPLINSITAIGDIWAKHLPEGIAS